MIHPSEARELCSKSEWELVESSFSPMVETFPRSGLKSRIDRIRKLHRKTGDLVSRQHSDSRKRTTRRKADLFAEAVARFEPHSQSYRERSSGFEKRWITTS